MRHKNWQCPKCSNRDFETGEVSGTGGLFSKFFNIQTQKFTTITCIRCKYTEMYKGETGTLENIFDFFGN